METELPSAALAELAAELSALPDMAPAPLQPGSMTRQASIAAIVENMRTTHFAFITKPSLCIEPYCTVPLHYRTKPGLGEPMAVEPPAPAHFLVDQVHVIVPSMVKVKMWKASPRVPIPPVP